MAIQDYEEVNELDWLQRHSAPSNGLRTYGISLEVENIVRRVRQGYIHCPRIPGGYGWSQEKASRFIDTLLRDEPTPPIYVYRDSSNKYLVIDGQQRIETMRRFYSGIFNKDKRGSVAFSLSDLDDILYQSLTYKQLPDDAKAVLDNYPVHYIIIEQEGKANGLEALYRIFERLNSGSIRLTAEDLRSAIRESEFGNLRCLPNRKLPQTSEAEPIDCNTSSEPMPGYVPLMIQRWKR
jgi:hypothetical protein